MLDELTPEHRRMLRSAELAREIALLKATPKQIGAVTKLLRQVQRNLRQGSK